MFWGELPVPVVLYEAQLDGVRQRACEIMTFGSDGKLACGEALYGAVP